MFKYETTAAAANAVRTRYPKIRTFFYATEWKEAIITRSARCPVARVSAASPPIRRVAGTASRHDALPLAPSLNTQMTPEGADDNEPDAPRTTQKRGRKG